MEPNRQKTNNIRRHKRGYLPHYDSPELIQFVTFRLAGSLPTTILRTLKLRLDSKQIDQIEYHRQIEKALDLGHGPTHLKDPRIARIVAETIVKFDGQKYKLLAWVIMANHVHLLLQTLAPYTLTQVIHSIKSFTGNAANKLVGLSGRFWSPDYFDRFMRDRVHLARAKKYIEENPVKAGLCQEPAGWPWGSAGWKG